MCTSFNHNLISYTLKFYIFFIKGSNLYHQNKKLNYKNKTIIYPYKNMTRENISNRRNFFIYKKKLLYSKINKYYKKEKREFIIFLLLT